MEYPLVSVILSCYNRPAMFQAALQSVLSQTYSHLEILIQDDSTNDDCSQVARQIPDRRVVYQRNVPSLGTSSNLLAGYRKARGKYFCTLNDDDWYAPQYLQTMVAALEREPSCSIAFCDHFIIDDEGTVDLARTEANSRKFGRTELAEGVVPYPLRAGLIVNSVPGMFAVFRREAMDLDDFPVEVSSGYDHWLTYLALRDGHNAYYLPQRLTYYRVHAGSQNEGFAAPAERLRYFEYQHYMHERFIADPRLQTLRQDFHSRLTKGYTASGLTLLRLGDKRRALQRFLAAWKMSPGARPLAGIILSCLPDSMLGFVLKTLSSWKV